MNELKHDDALIEAKAEASRRLPIFFLASSASLLTTVLIGPPRSVPRQGILLTVLLWLSVTLLQEGGTTLSLYPHLVLLCVLISFASPIPRAAQQARRSTKRRPIFSFFSGCGRYHGWINPLITSCLVGSWTALFLDTFFTSLVYPYLQVCALLVSFGHALYQYHQWRQRALHHELEGIPLVTSNNNLRSSGMNFTNHQNQSSSISPRQHRSHFCDDDKLWYAWNSHESLRWMTSTGSVFPNEDDRDTVRRILGSEGLTCRQLLPLSATELHQTTQLPLGLVLQLLEHVQALHVQFPCPPDLVPNYTHGTNPRHKQSFVSNRTNPDERFREESSSWLDRYDAEYSHSESSSRIHHQHEETRTISHDGYTTNNNTVDGDSIVVPEQRAQSLMKERYGLELPTIRPKSKEGNDGSNDHTLQPQSNRQDLSSLSSAAVAAAAAAAAVPNAIPLPVVAQSNTNKLDTMLPREFLDNMPPHIAAIAHSKPDLVRKILASKQQQQTLPPPPPPSSSGVATSPILDSKMSSISEQQIEDDDEDEQEEEEYTTSGDEGERTELLRQRRKKTPPKAYNSIWNG